LRYWDDMQSKYGFDDGDNEPAHAGEARGLYVRVLNTLLAACGALTRYEAFDRPGMHNSCLIVKSGTEDHEMGCIDESYKVQTAIDAANDMYLDDYIMTQTWIDLEALDQDMPEIVMKLSGTADLTPEVDDG
jgi:hypothetical protein